jgi:beta-N-acetylhexosaminidase
VTAFAGAYLSGLQSQGVVGSLKHWPGLGDVAVDPHEGLPIQRRSQTDLNNIDFAPYKALIAQGDVDMILTTYVTDTAYDPNLPGALSPIVIDQVLRGDLGFQGVVITDGLHMGAISNRWTAAQAAVLAVIAGDDLLLSFQAAEIPGVLSAFHTAIDRGQITRARIDLSVQRILALKIKYGLLTMPTA